LRSAIVFWMANTFGYVHDTSELGENAVAGRVDDAPAELTDHRQHGRLMPLEIAYRARFI